jgi:hypothetical protein
MRALILFSFLASILLAGCKKETEEFQTEEPSSYLPTQTGKYITYRIDSTIFTSFGANMVIHSYQEKHQVDAKLTDNLGRPSYRVFRFIRDVNGAGPWQPSGSYFITTLDKSIEVVEDNLRFLKLAGPVKEGNTWKGNRFLPSDPYGSFYEFSNDDAMVDWDYLYTNVGGSLTIGSKTYANTITVEQMKDSTNIPVSTTGAYGFINYSVDTYAQGIGLILQEVRMWEYQPPSTPRPGYKGFGIKRTIIDHN